MIGLAAAATLWAFSVLTEKSILFLWKNGKEGGSAGKYNVSRDPVTGVTTLTLLPAFLATLPDGPHTLIFQYNNGFNTASTVFYIGKAGSNVPETGDSAPLVLLYGLMLLSGAGLIAKAALGFRKRRSN